MIQQVAVRVDPFRIVRGGLVAKPDLDVDPFVMGEFRQEGGDIGFGDVFPGEIVDEFLPDLVKIRGATAVLREKGVGQFTQRIRSKQFGGHGERTLDEPLDVLEEKVAVDGHAPFLDILGAGVMARVAQVRAKFFLDALEVGSRGHRVRRTQVPGPDGRGCAGLPRAVDRSAGN